MFPAIPLSDGYSAYVETPARVYEDTDLLFAASSEGNNDHRSYVSDYALDALGDFPLESFEQSSLGFTFGFVDYNQFDSHAEAGMLGNYPLLNESWASGSYPIGKEELSSCHSTVQPETLDAWPSPESLAHELPLLDSVAPTPPLADIPLQRGDAGAISFSPSSSDASNCAEERNDGEASDGNTYRFAPYPRTSPKRRRKRRDRSTSSPKSTSPYSPPRSLKRTSPRNAQIVLSDEQIARAFASTTLQCPGCFDSFKRHNDLERHIITHSADQNASKWICCGVRAEEATKYGLDGATNYTYKGVVVTGGCWRVFSRKDALARHSCNKRRRCECDVNLVVELSEQ